MESCITWGRMKEIYKDCKDSDPVYWSFLYCIDDVRESVDKISKEAYELGYLHGMEHSKYRYIIKIFDLPENATCRNCMYKRLQPVKGPIYPGDPTKELGCGIDGFVIPDRNFVCSKWSLDNGK